MAQLARRCQERLQNFVDARHCPHSEAQLAIFNRWVKRSRILSRRGCISQHELRFNPETHGSLESLLQSLYLALQRSTVPVVELFGWT